MTWKQCALCVAPLFFASCLTGAAVDWAHPEVTILGRTAPKAPDDPGAVRIEVKNVDTRSDGHYLIQLPHEWPIGAEPLELPLSFEEERSFWLWRSYKALASRHFKASRLLRNPKDPFDLRADVQKDGAGDIRVAIFGDRGHDQHWTLLASTPIGHGTQGARRGFQKFGVVTAGVMADVAIYGALFVGLFVVAGPAGI